MEIQENVMTYLQWRGDLSFQQSPLNEIDNLIFCCLSYLDWSNLAEKFVPTVSLADATKLLLESKKDDKDFWEKSHVKLAQACMDAPRFQDVKIFAYVSRFSEADGKQFSATSFLTSDESLFVAFRGTDSTLTGWKEDFALAFSNQTPSQKDAVAYTNLLLSKIHAKHYYLGGHSKGGNLAIWAILHCNPSLYPKVKKVYNNDGPGMMNPMGSYRRYAELSNVIETIVPETSFVGMLLEHEEDYKIVKSVGKGFGQHEIYSWCIMANHLQCAEKTALPSKIFNSSMKNWVSTMNQEELEEFSETVFTILGQEDGVTTFQQLKEGGIKSLAAIVNNLVSLSPKQKSNLIKWVGNLLKLAGQKSLEGITKKPEENEV